MTDANINELSAALDSRYHRQLVLKEMGLPGQQRLVAAAVAVIGAGGLGSASAPYLVGAGIGRVVIFDDDVVDRTNLHRQTMFGEATIGLSKAGAAGSRLRALNPDVVVEERVVRITADNLDLLDGFDAIVDGSDNFATRYVVNQAGVKFDTPVVFGSATGFEGQLSVFATADGPCYRCVFPEPPPDGLIENCATGGVLGPVPGVIGTMQAVETIKLIAAIKPTLSGTLLMYDGLNAEVRKFKIARDPACTTCS